MQEADKKNNPSPSEDQQTQNLRYVGLIINSVIHSFNNATGLIRGYADLSLRATEPENRVYPYLQNIIDSIDSVNELSSKMQIFGEHEIQNYQLIPIGPVVEEAIESLPMSLGVLFTRLTSSSRTLCLPSGGRAEYIRPPNLVHSS